jgi:RNA polymerase sigma-70 factor, ECF subfamily
VEFSEFYERHRAKLTGVLVLGGASPADAADHVAEAFARAWERWDRVRGMDRSDLWVTTVAVNIARRTGRRRNLERTLLHRGRPDDVVPDAIEGMALWDVIQRLPPRQRLAVGLRYYQGLTEAQCATAMHVRPGTVAATLSHARAALAAALDEGSVDRAGPAASDAAHPRATGPSRTELNHEPTAG